METLVTIPKDPSLPTLVINKNYTITSSLKNPSLLHRNKKTIEVFSTYL